MNLPDSGTRKLTREVAPPSSLALSLDRASWWVAIGSAIVLVSTMVFLGRGLWRHFTLAAVVSFVLGFAGIRIRRIPLAAVAFALFVFPALCLFTIGSFYWPYHAIWMAAALGAALATPPYRWSVPRFLASSVALWTLSVALLAPIVASREADFTVATLQSVTARNSGVPAALIVAGVVFLGAWTLTAIIWFDRLFAVYADRPGRTFMWEVVVPLSSGWLIATSVGIYQWRVNLGYLSPGFWVAVGRATGTVLDANPFGAICGVWGVAAAGAALCLRRRLLAWSAASAALLLSWAGVWASGSRAAFVIVAFGTVVVGLVSVTKIPSRTARLLTVLAVIALMTAGVWAARTTGPFQRLFSFRTDLANSPGKALRGLWDRDGYGTASISMIREHPWTGVGIGLFHNEVPNYSPASLGYTLPPDNAQNWYRHQLAELGVVGSVGWMLWVLSMAYALLRGPTQNATPDVQVVRWTLVSFGVMSTVAMPGQDVAVGMMVLTLAFWYLKGARTSMPRVERIASSRWAWIAVWVIGLLSVALTISASRDRRPPFRAAQLDNDYSYGVHINAPDTAWTESHAVIVPQAAKPWLKLTYWIEHPDAATRPVRVEIWRDHDRIVDRKLWNDVRVTEYVPVAGGGKRFVLEVRVDRTFRPTNYDGSDAREHGLNLKWESVDNTAPGER